MIYKKVSKHVVRVTLNKLGNCNVYSYIIKGNNYNYVVDTGCGSEDAQIILDYLNKHKNGKPIRIINTHYHYDHIFGNAYLNAHDIISSVQTQIILIDYFEKALKDYKQYIRGSVEIALPNLTFDMESELDDLLFFTSKGHTSDGICIYYPEDKVLFVGDNIGDDDINIIPELEDSRLDYLYALMYMRTLNIKKVLSGHNEIKKASFLDEIIDRLVKEGV